MELKIQMGIYGLLSWNFWLSIFAFATHKMDGTDSMCVWMVEIQNFVELNIKNEIEASAIVAVTAVAVIVVTLAVSVAKAP